MTGNPKRIGLSPKENWYACFGSSNHVKDLGFSISPLAFSLNGSISRQSSPTVSRPHFRSVNYALSLWWGGIYINYLESFWTDNLSLLSHILIDSILYLYHYRYLFYSLGYNPVLLYFVAQTKTTTLFCCYSFGHWELFQLSPVFL